MQDICKVTHTPEVIAAYQAQQEARLKQAKEEISLLNEINQTEGLIPTLQKELDLSKDIFKAREGIGGVATSAAKTIAKFGGSLSQFLNINEAIASVEEYNKKVVTSALTNKKVQEDLLALETQKKSLQDKILTGEIESDEDFHAISQSWMNMNESLAKCSLKRMREPKFLLRAMALSDQALKEHMDDDVDQPDTKFTAPKITYEKLTTYWGERLDPKASHSHSVKKISPFDFATDLVTASQWLHALSVEQTTKMKSLDELYFSRYLNSVQHYPMLLAGRNFEDFDALAHLARQVHNRTAFYLLSEERTQDFESLVPTWTGLIAKLGSKATKAQLDEIYEGVRVKPEAIDALIEQMRNWSYKSSDKKKIRAVLSQLTRVVDVAGGKEDKDSPISYFSTKKDENKESWDIEHVSPSKGASKDSEVHKIGNLVLLKADHNSLKRADSPVKKMDVYKGSHLLLTQSLVGITVDKERKRVEDFFKTAGFSGAGWDVPTWDSSSMKSRENLYAALLKFHLTTLT